MHNKMIKTSFTEYTMLNEIETPKELGMVYNN
jgi:hypothetical protein